MTPQLKELDDKIKALLAESGHTLLGVPFVDRDGTIKANVMYAEVVQPPVEPTVGTLTDPA